MKASGFLLIWAVQACSMSAEPGPEAARESERRGEWAADMAEEAGRAARLAHSETSILSACTGDPLGSFDYCSTDCPCGAEQGDCDSDAECTTGLVCMRDTGGLFGFDPEVDTCMEPCSPEALGTPDFCSPECPCESGEGDCDGDSDCATGGVCVKNVGASYGFAADVDVCESTCDTCSPDCPCEFLCENDLDDDGDGLLDCADPDCAAVAACETAPAMERTIAPSFEGSVRFLYEGAEAVQIDADPAAMDPARMTVLRGRVTDSAGAPLEGVHITVLDGDAYGYTETRADGMFDFVVNGGGAVVVRYDAPDFLPAQRMLETGYHEHRWLPEVTLIPRDAVVTEIVLGAGNVQVARGSVQADEDGSRQATLIFPAGTQATAVLPDGSQVALGTMHVRATEYTVGPRGPAAMPGTLPPTSGYTYAAELSVDEAEALGASAVIFDEPVGFYVDNFLGFPVGTTVPLGYYDRDEGRWVPADSGVVLAILGIQDGLATIDLDGDGAAEDAAALAAAGIDEAERAELATLYAAGQTLWRVSIPHFTPWDCNWPFGPPAGAAFPDFSFARGPSVDVPCTRSGSVIQCESQSLGQLVAVPATHVTLAYHGHRTRGWEPDHEIALQLTQESYPASLKAVVVEAEIAGQRFEQRLEAAPGLRSSIFWDGRDAYGRLIQGRQRARVRVGHVYAGVYGNAPRFGVQGDGPISGSSTREEVTLWRETEVPIGNWDAAPQGLGGFGLASHHAYDPESQTLFLGDGTQRSARSVAPVLVEVGAPDIGPGGSIYAVHAAPDGSFYTASTDGRIHHIASDGAVTLLADGLADPRDVAIATDGTLYVAETGALRITAIAPDGTRTTFAGGGTDPFLDISGAAIPATAAALHGPTALALAPDGSLYFLDPDGPIGLVRVVDPSGMLSNVHGLGAPVDLALGPNGSLYVSQGGGGVRRIDPDGRVEIALPISSGLAAAGLAVHADGAMLVADISTGRVMRIEPDWTSTVVAGGGDGDARDGAISTERGLPALYRIDIDAAGALCLSDGQRVFRVRPAAPGRSADDIAVPSRDGATLYFFDRHGRHQETRDALTNAVLRAFSYDAHGRVIAVTDGDGLATSIERDAIGLAQAIVGPYGQRTALFYDASDQLERLHDPLDREITFGYDEQGRLATMLDARQGLHQYDYDALGRLVTDIGPTGYTQTLALTEGEGGSRSVAVTTSAGRTTRYESGPTGENETLRTVHTPSGHTGTVRRTSGTREVTAPDGTLLRADVSSDPRWQSLAPWSRATLLRTPAGREFAATAEREVTFSDPSQPHFIASLIERHTVDGRTAEVHYDAAARTVTTESPAGRTRTVTLDVRGRISQVDQPGLAPVSYQYDVDGRVERIQHGTGTEARVSLLSYDANGNLQTRTDPLGRAHAYTHDVLGRLRALEGPDLASIAFDYDAHDNLTQLVPPGRPAHAFQYTGADQAERYVPPALAGLATETHFGYDPDLAIASIDGPGTQAARFGYDAAGRLETLTVARGTYRHDYDPATGALAAITSPDAIGLTFQRDGPLLLATDWTLPGAVTLAVAQGYDTAWRLASLQVASAAPIAFGYDTDDLLIQAGPLTITRDVQTGLPAATQAGVVSTSMSVTAFAEPAHLAATAGGQGVYEASFTRDALGRITHIEELVAGASRAVTYAYDAADRLAHGAVPGAPARDYLYDANGNLTEIHAAGLPVLTATYDDQDRLLTHCDLSFTYTPAGHRETRLHTGTGQVTAYQYDELGNLLGVALPDGRALEYLVDGADRRVAKRVDGALQWFLVYAGGLPVARLHADGTVESRYVYGAAAHVPDLVLRGGRTYRILTDHLGSPRLVVDVESGAVVQRLDYDVHGRILMDSNPGFQPFAFAGGLHDPDTGLLRFGARDYDPEVGRWTAKDPTGFAGGDTNLYAYAGGDPVNYIDPNGELAFLAPLVIAAVKGALAGAAIGGGMALGSELIEVGGDIDCVDWGNVSAGAADGGLWGAAGGALLQGAGRAYTAARGAATRNVGRELTEAELSAVRGGAGRKPGSLGRFKGRDALRAENKMARDAAREAGLDRAQRRILHDEISGQGLTYHEIVGLAKHIAAGT